jgi:polyhydroxybutyrate depolymerase
VRHSLRGRVVLRNPSRPALGVDEWARFWVAVNRASNVPIESELPPDTTIRTWHGSTPSCDVVFYRVEGGGHTWPGSRITLPGFLFGRTSRTFDATQVCWNFLAAHSR